MQGWRSDKGFSLVEVMVVVAIIGLMTSAVVLTMPDADDTVEKTLGRTEQAMIALERHSILTGKILGVRFGVDGFETLEFTDGGWMPAPDILKSAAMTFAPLLLDHLDVAGAEQDLTTEAGPPQVWFLPTGEKPDFSVTLVSADSRMTLRMPENGAAKVLADG